MDVGEFGAGVSAEAMLEEWTGGGWDLWDLWRLAGMSWMCVMSFSLATVRSPKSMLRGLYIACAWEATITMRASLC